MKPSIGRKVWYWPSMFDLGIGRTYISSESVMQVNQGMDATKVTSQPCDATIVFVHSDSMVNLRVTDHNGNTHTRTSVALFEPQAEAGRWKLGNDAVLAPQVPFAQWMPYQVSQAK